MGRLEVTKCRKTPIGTKITVRANKKAVAYFDSFLGERVFTLKKGYQLTLTVKGWDWDKGDTLSMVSLVGYAWNWSNIPWDWSY